MKPKDQIKTENPETIIETLAENKWFRVPEFQRGYRWGQNEISELFEDIMSTDKNKTQCHFIGTYVIVHKESERFLCEDSQRSIIIDGQQRLATVSMMLAVIKDICSLFGWAVHNLLPSRLGREIDDGTSCDRIVMGEHDRELYHAIISEKGTKDKAKIKKYVLGRVSKELKLLNLPELVKKKGNFNGRLYKAYQIILREISNSLPDADKDAESWIDQLSRLILFRIIGCEVKTLDDSMAYEVFEALNARGLGLTPSELLKNHLFSVAKQESSLPTVRSNWTAMEQSLPSDDASGFLRHWYMSTKGYVTQKNLYRGIRDLLSDGQLSALKLSNELKDEAGLYGKLVSPSGQFKAEITESLLGIKDLGMNVLYPLLLSVFWTYSAKKHRLAVTEFLEKLSFRAITICGGRGSELEKECCQLAVDIRNSPRRDPMSVIKPSLLKLNPEDPFFFSEFKKKEFSSNTKPARYLFIRIDSHIKGLKPTSAYTLNRNNVNIEHIFPQKPDDQARAYMKQQGISSSNAGVIGLLGNLTIMREKYNVQASNSQFPVKQKGYYSKGDTELTKMLAKGFQGMPPYSAPQAWNESEIKRRQTWLVEYAETHKLWDLN